MSTTSECRIVSLSQKRSHVWIPKELREKHGIKPGSRVQTHESEREIVVEPLPNLQAFRGATTTADRGTAIFGEERKPARSEVNGLSETATYLSSTSP